MSDSVSKQLTQRAWGVLRTAHGAPALQAASLANTAIVLAGVALDFVDENESEHIREEASAVSESATEVIQRARQQLKGKGRSPNLGAPEPEATVRTSRREVPVTYVVVPGDSLSKIALKLGRAAAEWELLFEINKEAIAQAQAARGKIVDLANPDPNLIYAGTALVVPLEWRTVEASKQKVIEVRLSSGAKRGVVVAGVIGSVIALALLLRRDSGVVQATSRRSSLGTRFVSQPVAA